MTAKSTSVNGSKLRLIVAEMYLRKALDVHTGEVTVADIVLDLPCADKLMSFAFPYLLNYSRLIAT